MAWVICEKANVQLLSLVSKNMYFNTRQYRCTLSTVYVGETSAGKSSFLNLLLEGISLDGQRLELPKSEQMTTSCICEIKHGEERELIAHYNKPRERETDIEIIKNPTIDHLNKILNVKHSGQAGSANFSMYKKIELRVPVDFLKVSNDSRCHKL